MYPLLSSNNVSRRMIMKVAMKNPSTGELQEVKVGWSWTLFLFAGLFGLPLFLRKLHIWGGIYLVLWALLMLVTYLGTGDIAIIGSSILNIIFLCLNVFLAIKGNEMTAKNYLEHGWIFTDPDSDAVRMAKGKWGII